MKKYNIFYTRNPYEQFEYLCTFDYYDENVEKKMQDLLTDSDDCYFIIRRSYFNIKKMIRKIKIDEITFIDLSLIDLSLGY